MRGRTSVRIPDKLQKDRTYFWRARAQDGANTGPLSAVGEVQHRHAVVAAARLRLLLPGQRRQGDRPDAAASS